MQTLAWQHPVLYRRLLKLCLVSTLIPGLYATTTQKSWSPAWRLPAMSRLETAAEVQVVPVINNRADTKVKAVGLLPPYGGPVTSHDAKIIAKRMSDNRFGPGHWSALEKLWARESGWNPAARNPSSGACGIPQALPCRKITDMSVPGQIEWGVGYIAQRYGNPTRAWQHFLSHGWY
jgi:hypothetical protein